MDIDHTSFGDGIYWAWIENAFDSLMIWLVRINSMIIYVITLTLDKKLFLCLLTCVF